MDNHFFLKEIPQQLFETDYISICLVANQSLILLIWKRQITLYERIEGFNQGLSITKKYKAKYWLVDDLQLPFISEKEKEWIVTKWIELAAKSSIIKIAVVTPDYMPALIANTEFTIKGKEQYQAKGIIQYDVLTDYTTALNWLFSDSDLDEH